MHYPGAVINNRGMICSAPAAATVVAIDRAVVWRLRRTNYQRALRAYQARACSSSAQTAFSAARSPCPHYSGPRVCRRCDGVCSTCSALPL
eukprot:6948855-Prymnesium_polylepis.1